MGLEPTWTFAQRFLGPLRIPFPPPRQKDERDGAPYGPYPARNGFQPSTSAFADYLYFINFLSFRNKKGELKLPFSVREGRRDLELGK